MRINGIQSDHSQEKERFRPVECERCHVKNCPDAKYCNGCGLAFDLKYATEVDQRKEDIKEKIERLSDELAKSPEVVDRLLEALVLLRQNKNDE